jgi:hypothetical protein
VTVLPGGYTSPPWVALTQPSHGRLDAKGIGEGAIQISIDLVEGLARQPGKADSR